MLKNYTSISSIGVHIIYFCGKFNDPWSYNANTKMQYKKFLIQQQSYNGTSYTNVGSVVETEATYHVACQEMPFKHLPEAKELAKRDWYDENGEDVYIPTDGLKFNAYDLEAKFLYVGTEADMQSDLRGFINFLYGRNTGGAPMLAVYDEYTKTGRRGLIVQEVDNELLAYDDKNANVIGVFKVKFRVTDPVTNMKYYNGNIVVDE